MTKTFSTLLLSLLLFTSSASAEGLPVSKYLEDPEHKNDVILFYLSTIFSGINLANSRLERPFFCMSGATPESALEMIDKRINKMQKEKKLTEDTTVDSIMMDILIEEFPCK